MDMYRNSNLGYSEIQTRKSRDFHVTENALVFHFGRAHNIN